MSTNKPVLIIENCSKGLTLNENITDPKKNKIFLDGIFTEFDVMNRNERIYTANKFLPHLDDLLERKKTFGVLYGEFDHPDVFDTSLGRVSHTVESVRFNKEQNRVDGEIRLLNTHYGKEAQALVLDGCPIFVSSRAAGVTEANGHVSLKKLFTYDCVADPGFSSAKLNVKSLNESLGYNESSNFRIYEIDDESKFNTLLTMENKNNEHVTKTQMTEYSEYLASEIENIKGFIGEHLKTGQHNPKQLDNLYAYYENLQNAFTKVSSYLDYLADNIQILVDENKSLKETQTNLIRHNDYIADNLNNTIKYTEYVAEKLDTSIDYSEYIAEKLSKSIDFSEYIAENVDKTIKYSEYLAESIDKSIDYAEYIAENLDNSIAYTEYVAESLDNSIAYSEYIAENLESSIAYSEYIAENVDNNIAYTEYVAEHVDNSIQYAEYIAEGVGDNIAYTNYLAESLDKTIDAVKGSKLFENVDTEDQDINDLQVDDVSQYYADQEDEDEIRGLGALQSEIDNAEDDIEDADNVQALQDDVDDLDTEDDDDDAICGPCGQAGADDDIELGDEDIDVDVQIAQPDETLEVGEDEGFGVLGELLPGTLVKIDDDKSGEIKAYNPQNGMAIVQITGTEATTQIHESRVTVLGDKLFNSEKTFKSNISELIAEAKKRKAADEQEPHFLLFLSDKNKAAYAELSFEDRETVKAALNESTYTSESQVMRLINEALSKGKKSESESLLEAMPKDLVDTWKSLNEKTQVHILKQAKLYNGLTDNQAKMESFWYSRDLSRYTDKTDEKKLLNENVRYIDNNKLSDNELDHYLRVFKNL